MVKQIGYNMVGSLVISLDFELFWGLAGWTESQLNDYRPRIEGAVKALQLILETFTKYNIKCTIGFVSGINYASLSDYLSVAPIEKPSYKKELFSSYGLLHTMLKKGRIDSNLLFRPDTIKILKKNPLVELGSHTFSHYYALEEGQTIGQFEADIKTAQEEANKMNVSLKTIIFPRNQIPTSYHDVCAKYGFTHIRGNEESLLYKSETTPSKYDIKRILRLFDCYFNITGHHTYKAPKRGVLIDVTASRFLRAYNNTLKLFEPLKIKRIMDDIKYAAKHGEIYHLWWHPHNFGINTNENILQLENICNFFSEMRDKYGMNSKFMCEID